MFFICRIIVISLCLSLAESSCKVRRRKSFFLFFRRIFMIIEWNWHFHFFIQRPKWVNSNVSRVSLSSKCLSDGSPIIILSSDDGREGEVNSFLWFVSRWMKCDFFFVMKFDLPSEITTKFQFVYFFCFISFFIVIWISICSCFHADNWRGGLRNTVVKGWEGE